MKDRAAEASGVEPREAPSSGSVAASRSPFKPGDMLAGKYRVEREIGRGGMGTVLAALHIELDQRVAIKVLHASAAENPDFAARFAREARAAAKIRSEHVARVLDVGTLESGTAYIVMEYLEGEDLAEVLRLRGALPVAQAVDLVIEACQAVAAAHAAGVVHRDIKPANLFIAKNPDRSTTLKVLDFGVAKVTAREGQAVNDGSSTETGHIFGSPTYMSPEQLRSTGRVDTRADIWALGVVLHELCVNATPFWRGAVAEILAAIMRDPPPPLRTALPGAPEGLEQVILRCLEKEPQRRFANVAQLARALAPFASKPVNEAVERMERLLGSAAVTADVAPESTAAAPAPAVAAPPPAGRATLPSEPRDAEGRATLAASSQTWRSVVPASRRGRALAVVGLAAALAVVGARLVMTGSPSPSASVSAAAVAPASAAVVAPPVTTAVPSPSRADPTASASAAPVPAKPASIRIAGAPAGTKVYRGASLLGTAPGPIELPRGAEPIVLRFTADGFTPAEISVVPDADRELTVSLARAPRARPRVSKDLETF